MFVVVISGLREVTTVTEVFTNSIGAGGDAVELAPDYFDPMSKMHAGLAETIAPCNNKFIRVWNQ